MSAISIEPLRIEQWREYKHIRLQMLQESPAAFSGSYEEECWYADDYWQNLVKRYATGIGNRTFMALRDGKPVGMAGYFHELRYKLRHVATIVSVYVQPDTRKQGIARQLMETVLADLTGLGYIRKAKLTVNPCQKEAVALYERLGFTRAGVLKEEMRVGDRFDDHWIMEKQLTTVS